MRRRAIPLQIKLALLLVVIVTVPLGVAAYFVGDISRVATNLSAAEAQLSRIAVLEKSMRTYHEMIDTTKRLHAEVANRLAKRSDVTALDPELVPAQLADAVGVDVSRQLAKVLHEPQQGGLVGLSVLRGDGTVFAETT